MEIGWLTCFKAISRLRLEDVDGAADRSARIADGTTSAKKLTEEVMRLKKNKFISSNVIKNVLP